MCMDWVEQIRKVDMPALCSSVREVPETVTPQRKTGGGGSKGKVASAYSVPEIPRPLCFVYRFRSLP